jgi:hypothetical protein
MIPKIRAAFNNSFENAYYENLLEEVAGRFGEPCPFRISETPVFISKGLKEKVFEACDAILEQLETFDFDAIRNRFMPAHLQSPGLLGVPHFLGIDFGLCESDKGEIEPQLIELQAFPSLFFYQQFLGDALKRNYPNLPVNGFHYFFSGLDDASYLREMSDLILGEHDPENVVLMELFPERQKTRIDFWATKQALGIEVVCYTRILREGRQLYYMKDGKKTPIKRIYNRVIYDELQRIPDLKTNFSLFDDVDVEWVTHPDWFFIISKSIMPMLRHKYIPESHYLDKIPVGTDLSKYVLKPMFSFAGAGINLNPTDETLREIPDRENYLLQKKVSYAPLIKTRTDKNAKVELRILYIWSKGENRFKPVINLTRMAKGALINVSHVTDERWIGSSISFFET